MQAKLYEEVKKKKSGEELKRGREIISNYPDCEAA